MGSGEDTSAAFLLLADISGYTKFVKMHGVSSSHARQIVSRLLNSIIRTSSKPLVVSEIEGDAIFFYAPFNEGNKMRTIENIKGQIIKMHEAFMKELSVMRNMNVCFCDACKTAGDLRLKQLVHSGEIQFQKINRNEKLFGLDVIIVHRMLKNNVPSNEYIMMTETCYETFNDFYELCPETFKQEFEGIGEVQTEVFYPSDAIYKMASNEPDVKPRFIDRLKWFAGIESRLLMEKLRLKKMDNNFNNIPD